MSSAIFEMLDWFITYVCVNLFMDNYLQIRFLVIWYVFLYEFGIRVHDGNGNDKVWFYVYDLSVVSWE